MFQLVLEKAEEPEIKLPTFFGSSKKQQSFRKARETKDQIANVCWITEKEREFQKNIHFCFIDYAKAFDSGKF